MSCTTSTTARHPLPRAPYPPLPDGPCLEQGRVVLPPRTGLVARDLLAALLAGLYEWQHAALDLTLTFDRYVKGRRQPYAAVGHILGCSIDLLPRDDAGTAWAVIVGCPHRYLSRSHVPLS